NVVKHGGEFQNLESLLAQIAVATDIAIAESQNMPELMRQGPRRQIAGAKRDVSSNETMRRLSARRQHDAIDWKTAGMGSCIDVSAGLRRISVAIDVAERYIPDLNLQSIERVGFLSLPHFLDHALHLRQEFLIFNIRINRNMNDDAAGLRTIHLNERWNSRL